MLPDSPAIDKEFHYAVPPKFRGQLVVGSRVRVALHGRRIGAWVTAIDPPAEPDVELKPLAGLSGLGPPASVIELAEWAAWRWAGRRAHFLSTADPPRVVRAPPSRNLPSRTLPGITASTAEPDPALERVNALGAFDGPPTVVRVPPAAETVEWAHAAAEAGLGRGGAIVVVPGAARAMWLSRQLRARGLPVAAYPEEWARAAAGEVVVVGTRSAAWAPLERIGASLVVDSHDEGLREERSPTWEATLVLAERCARDGGVAVRLSPCPTLEDLEWGRLITVPRAEEHAGWASLEIVDRREADPRDGLLTPRVVNAVRSGKRVACVINRKGHAGLLVCSACEAVAVCEACGGAVTQTADSRLTCGRCGVQRPPICLVCSSVKLKGLRPGTTRLAEHLAALVGHPVPELTATAEGKGTERPSEAPVVVGTEAALHRAGRRDTVIFLDFDQELLAPRLRASEQAMALLARASRLVRGRRGRVVVQTRQPDHPVLSAASTADPGSLTDAERAQRQELGLPPFSAVAEVSGAGAEEFVAGIPATVRVGRAGDEGRWLVRAVDHPILCDALAATPRPPTRLRVEVDPRRI